MSSQITKWFKNPWEIEYFDKIRKKNKQWLATCGKCGKPSIAYDCEVNSAWIVPVCKKHIIHKAIEKELG